MCWCRSVDLGLGYGCVLTIYFPLLSPKGLKAYKIAFLFGSISQLLHSLCLKELALNKTGTLQR